MKKIILTGGGTAGHVTPNIALAPKLISEGYEIFYIGGKNGIERDLIEKEKIPYFGISAGKLRRYLDLRNVSDIFRVVKGVGEAFSVIRRIKPDVVFSKGGFVTVPVVAAARLTGVPVVIHESDYSPGLANKLSVPFANAVCVSFPETLAHISGKKAVLTGSPIRAQLFAGSPEKGKALCGFKNSKPIVLMIGGSLGSVKINQCLCAALPVVLRDFQVVHLCGKGNLDTKINYEGYKQFEFVTKELPDLLAMADVVLSRAGANTIFELLALKKPMLLVPLSKNASRGDQILNARSFQKQGYAMMLAEEEMNAESLAAALTELYKNRQKIDIKMTETKQSDGTKAVFDVIRNLTNVDARRK